MPMTSAALRASLLSSMVQQPRVTLAAREEQVGVAGEAPLGVAVEAGVGNPCAHAADQRVTQLLQPGGQLGLVLHRELDRGREPGDGRGVQGPGADVALLAAPVLEGGQLQLTAYDERADAVRPADL